MISSIREARKLKATHLTNLEIGGLELGKPGLGHHRLRACLATPGCSLKIRDPEPSFLGHDWILEMHRRPSLMATHQRCPTTDHFLKKTTGLAFEGVLGGIDGLHLARDVQL